MATIDEIKANAQKVWPQAKSIDVYPGAAGHVSYTGPDPTGFTLVARASARKVIEQLEAESLDQLDANVRRLFEAKKRKE